MNPSEQTDQAKAESEAVFNMGQNTQKKNTTLAGKSAEQRMQESFNTGAKQGESTKRQREEYSIQLRKDKRDQMLKKKRGEGKQLPQQSMNASEQQISRASIDEALEMSQKITILEFSGLLNHMTFKLTDFQRLLVLIMSENEVEVLLATVGFRRLLSFEDSPPIQPVIDANLVPRFIKLLSHDAVGKLQFEACWCLTNLASGSSEHVQILLEKGVVNELAKLINSPHQEIIEQAIWAIGNLAGDNAHVRDVVMAVGVVPSICDKLDQAPAASSFVRNASWTLSNFCRGRPGPKFEMIERAIPSLVKVLVENTAEDIIVDVCWALSYTSDGGDEHIQKIINSGGLKRLIECLDQPNLAVTISCLRTLGNILTGNDQMVNLAIESGVLQALSTVMMHPKMPVRKETCWSLSNITAGNTEQIQLCINSGIVDQLVQLLMQDGMEIKKEAVWALSNTTANASPEQFKILVEKNIIKALGSMLNVKEPRILLVALEGLQNILACGQKHFASSGENEFALVVDREGVLDYLEQLQTHQNHQIYERSIKILEDYFQMDDDEDQLMNSLNTQSTQAAQQFSF